MKIPDTITTRFQEIKPCQAADIHRINLIKIRRSLMFNSNFYPTPNDVIKKMIEDEYFTGKKILEPSAGKGNICDYVSKSLRLYYGKEVRNNMIDCIELDYELQATLRGKDYSVIHNDFLTFVPDQYYDYIIMNPPFDDGAKHLLKAIEIAKGAKIICLLNSETINNPYTKERELLLKKLEDNEAVIEDLGQCFMDSERKTAVNVTMIKMIAGEDAKKTFEFQPKDKSDKEYDVKDLNNEQVARIDVIGNLVDRYNACTESCKTLVQAYNEVKYYSEGLIKNSDDLFKIINKAASSNSMQFYNSLTKMLRQSAWDKVMQQANFMRYLTTGVQRNLSGMEQQQGVTAFTIENIDALFMSLFANKDKIFESCIEEVFDYMTNYYPENRLHVEGWKTNSQWKVNRRVILPVLDNRNSYNKVQINYALIRQIDDIDKAMCYINGDKYENIKKINSIDGEEYGALHQTEYFEVRAYKKGTLHLYFKDEYLWSQFNQTACKGKNWLRA